MCLFFAGSTKVFGQTAAGQVTNLGHLHKRAAATTLSSHAGRALTPRLVRLLTGQYHHLHFYGQPINQYKGLYTYGKPKHAS